MKKEIFIIGGGNSLKEFDFSILKNKEVIVVNKSILSFPNPKYFITMDFTFLKKLKNKSYILKNTSTTKIFIANFCFPYIEESDGKIVDARFNLVYKLNDFDLIIKSHGRENFGLTFKEFRNGQNSAYCALQLAIILGYEEINLLGFDLVAQEQTHYHGGYNQNLKDFQLKLEEYYDYFKNALLDLQSKKLNIKIYSCSKISRLNEFLPYKEIVHE